MRWGVVTTVAEPPALLAAFVAHYARMGAGSIRLYFDRPDPEAAALISRVPGSKRSTRMPLSTGMNSVRASSLRSSIASSGSTRIMRCARWRSTGCCMSMPTNSSRRRISRGNSRRSPLTSTACISPMANAPGLPGRPPHDFRWRAALAGRWTATPHPAHSWPGGCGVHRQRVLRAPMGQERHAHGTWSEARPAQAAPRAASAPGRGPICQIVPFRRAHASALGREAHALCGAWHVCRAKGTASLPPCPGDACEECGIRSRGGFRIARHDPGDPG